MGGFALVQELQGFNHFDLRFKISLAFPTSQEGWNRTLNLQGLLLVQLRRCCGETVLGMKRRERKEGLCFLQVTYNHLLL